MRACAQQDPLLQRKLTRAAEKRLRGFLHVGLMERLDDSIASMAVSAMHEAWFVALNASLQISPGAALW